MKSKKMLTRLLGEMMEQRDLAEEAAEGAARGERRMIADALALAGQVEAADRDYPLRVLRDAYGGEWAWVTHGAAARRVHDDMGEDQIELHGVTPGEGWRAAWYYCPNKAQREAGEKIKTLGEGRGLTRGEALLDMIRRGAPAYDGGEK